MTRNYDEFKDFVVEQTEAFNELLPTPAPVLRDNPLEDYSNSKQNFVKSLLQSSYPSSVDKKVMELMTEHLGLSLPDYEDCEDYLEYLKEKTSFESKSVETVSLRSSELPDCALVLTNNRRNSHDYGIGNIVMLRNGLPEALHNDWLKYPSGSKTIVGNNLPDRNTDYNRIEETTAREFVDGIDWNEIHRLLNMQSPSSFSTITRELQDRSVADTPVPSVAEATESTPEASVGEVKEETSEKPSYKSVYERDF